MSRWVRVSIIVSVWRMREERPCQQQKPDAGVLLESPDARVPVPRPSPTRGEGNGVIEARIGALAGEQREHPNRLFRATTPR